MSLLDAVNLTTGRQTQPQFKTEGGSGLLQAVKLSRGEQVQTTQKQVQLPEPQEKVSFFSKIKSFLDQPVPEMFQSKANQLPEAFRPRSSQEVLELSVDDLARRVSSAQSSNRPSKLFQKALLLADEARKPEASEIKRHSTALLMRGLRFGWQGGASLLGFGASTLDAVTERIERGDKKQAERFDRFYEKTGDEKYKNTANAIRELGKEEIKTRKYSKSLKKWADEVNVDDPNFAEKVVEGAGSMLGFTLLSLVSGGGSTLPFVAESVIEASSTYEELRDRGESIDKASIRADQALLANLVVNKYLNIFDDLFDSVKGIKKTFKGISLEGIQEGYQQIVSNLTTDKPWDEGVLESMAIGGTLGGVTTIILPGGNKVVMDNETQQSKVVKQDEEVFGIPAPKEDTTPKTAKDAVIIKKEVSSTLSDRGEVSPGVKSKKEVAPISRGEGVSKELITLSKEAKKYTSAKDFATTQGTSVDRQIGVLDADKISPRDEVDKTTDEYKGLVESIKKEGIKEPVIVTVEDGKITTFEGSHRVTAAQELGVNVPVIVTKGSIEGFNTISKFYDQSKTKPKPKVKTKAKLVPRAQVPVGEGKTKVSRLEARIKQSLGELSEEQIKDMGLPTFKEMNKKENITKAAKFVAENPEKALDVLTGKIDAPKGILRNSILIAMQNLNTKDIDIATRLATLQSTRAGQEISILTEVNKNLPVNILSDIIRVRTQALEKRYGGKKAKSIVRGKVKKGKSMIKAKMNWDSILQEVRC